MTRSRIFAVATCALLSRMAWAEDSSGDLRQQVAELKNQVQEMQTRQAQNSREVAATIETVLRDAEQRSQLMAAGDSGAGYDSGFYIRSGAFEMRPSVMFQFWNVTDYRESAGGKNDQTENGFEVHRLEFALNGTAFTKDLAYGFFWINGGDSGVLNLRDAWIQYMFADQWGVRAGQFTANFTHEDWLADNTQLAADRSLLDGTIGGYTNRVQGASLLYGNYSDKNPINAELCLNDGSNSLNSSYLGHIANVPTGDPGTVDGPIGPGPHAFDWGVYGRFEWKVMGSWGNYGDFTAKNVKDNLLVLGAGFSYDQGGDGSLLAGTVDVQYKMANGLALYGAAVVRNNNSELSGRIPPESATDWGLLGQVSYLFNPAWEVFGRWAFIDFDRDVTAPNGDTETQFHEIAIGVNYYLGANGSAGHRAKITVELDYLPNGAPGDFTFLGYRGDNNFNNELALRTAFQLTL